MTSTSNLPDYCKAITYSRRGGPKDVLTFEDKFPVPKRVGKGEILIKTEAVAINPVDLKFMKTLPSFGKKVAGSDFSGTIVEIDPSINHLQKGDKVFGAIDPSKKFTKGHGSFSQFILAQPSVCTKIPSNISFEQASGCTIVGLTAVGMARQSETLQANARILVCGGSSAVGLMLIPILHHKGFFVTSTCSQSKSEIVQGRGAKKTFDYRNEQFQSNLLAETEKDGQFDLILDCVESYDVLAISPKILKKGAVYGNVGFDTTNGMLSAIKRNLSYHLLPSFLGGIPSNYQRIAAIPNEETLNKLYEYLEKGITSPVIDSTFEWDQTKEAFEKVETNHCTGKVVVKVPQV